MFPTGFLATIEVYNSNRMQRIPLMYAAVGYYVCMVDFQLDTLYHVDFPHVGTKGAPGLNIS